MLSRYRLQGSLAEVGRSLRTLVLATGVAGLLTLQLLLQGPRPSLWVAGAMGVTWGALSWSCLRLLGQYRRLRSAASSVETDLAVRVDREEREAESARRDNQRVVAILEEDKMWPVFQPVVDLCEGTILGVEALTRFDEGSPESWFTEAANMGLGTKLEIRAIEGALQVAERLPDDLFVAVNVSPETLCTTDLVLALRASHIPLERIVLEITEHAMVQDYQVIKHQIEDLRTLGLSIAVDDVGAGYSNMAHVLHLRPDIVKFDRGLAQNLDQDGGRLALVRSLATFNRFLEAITVAEGVEREEEVEVLREAGIGTGQGYLFAPPRELPLDPLAFVPQAPIDLSDDNPLPPGVIPPGPQRWPSQPAH